MLKHILSALVACTAAANALTVQHLLGQSPAILDEPIPGESPLELCDSDYSQLLKLKSVVLDPVPPQRGQNLTIHAIGTLDKAVDEGAYVDVDVSYGYIKLIHETYDLCEELPHVDMTCPVNKGHYELVKEVEIPDEVPPGKYIVVARAYTKDDELITCLTGTVEFPPYDWAGYVGQKVAAVGDKLVQLIA